MVQGGKKAQSQKKRKKIVVLCLVCSSETQYWMSCTTEQLVQICECDSAERQQVYTQVNDYLQSVQNRLDASSTGPNGDTHWISVERYVEQCASLNDEIGLDNQNNNNNISSLFVSPDFESLKEDEQYEMQYIEYAKNIRQQQVRQQQQQEELESTQGSKEEQLCNAEKQQQLSGMSKQVKRKSNASRNANSNRRTKQRKSSQVNLVSETLLQPLPIGIIEKDSQSSSNQISNPIAIPELPGPDSVLVQVDEFTSLPNIHSAAVTNSYSDDEEQNAGNSHTHYTNSTLTAISSADLSAGNANLRLLIQIEHTASGGGATNSVCTVAEQCFSLFPDTCHQQVHGLLVQTIGNQQTALAHTFNNNVSVRLKAERDTLIAQYAQTYFTWYDALISEQLSHFANYKQSETPCFLQRCAILITGIPFYVKCTDPKLKKIFPILTEFKEKRLRAMIYRAFILRDMHEYYVALTVAVAVALAQREDAQHAQQSTDQQQKQQAQQLVQRVECHLNQLNFNKGMTKEIRKQLNYTRSLLAAQA